MEDLGAAWSRFPSDGSTHACSFVGVAVSPEEEVPSEAGGCRGDTGRETVRVGPVLRQLTAPGGSGVPHTQVEGTRGQPAGCHGATRQKGWFWLELRQGMETDSELGFKDWHRTGKKSHSRLMGQLSGAESLSSMEYSGNS